MARPQTISDEQIDEAARNVFFRDGPTAPLAAIAEELGVSAPAIINRVGSKENLLARALCQDLPKDIKELFAGRLSEDCDMAAELSAILVRVLVVYRDVVPSLIVARTAGSLSRRSAERELPHRTLRRLLAAWLRRATQTAQSGAPDPKLSAEIMISVIEARCYNDFIAGEEPVTRADVRFIRNLVNGLLPNIGSH